MDDTGVRRVYFIDWLRILAVLLLLPFHTLRVFDEADPFYVKALPVSFWVGRALKFISVWHMPLLFLLAGCSTYYALHKRSGGQYSWERVKRLLVPFVFGFFILIPPQTWYGGRFNSGYTGSYWHYLVSGDFLHWNVQNGGDYFGGFGIGHLWFILFLFLISLVALPLLLWAARGGGVRRMQAFCRRLAHPAGWLLAIIILFVGGLAPDIPGGPIVFYLFLFVLGFIAALVAGVGLTVFWAVGTSFRESFSDTSWQRLGLEFGGTVAMWLMLMGILGFGKRYLNRTSRTQKYLAEASYPVYILHQTVIVIIGFYVIQLAAPRPVLWVILLLAAVLGTFALYEIVRRVGVLRFLFGMRPRRKAPGAIGPAPTAVEPASAHAETKGTGASP
jgi:glucan biosynthesis protein C